MKHYMIITQDVQVFDNNDQPVDLYTVLEHDIKAESAEDALRIAYDSPWCQEHFPASYCEYEAVEINK